MSEQAIRLEAPNKSHAVRLAEQLASYGAEVQRTDTGWEVRLPASTMPLHDAIEAVGIWLAESRLSSCRIHVGGRTYVFLQPMDELPPDSPELLLERTIQLQMALDSRLVIEQAKGVLAERLDVAPELAFEILRRAARSTGESIHVTAAAVVGSRESPDTVQRATLALADGHGQD